MFRGRCGYGFYRLPVFALTSYAGHASAFSCVAAPRVANGEAWWSQTGSNRRPHACKARALPAELWPRNQKTNAAGSPSRSSRLPHGPPSPFGLRRGSLHSLRERRLVGLGRLELPTSRLSSARSNQLSYKPLTLLLEIKRLLEIKDRLRPKDRGIGMRASGVERRLQSHKRSAPGACSSAKKEKRRRRNPAYRAQQSQDCWPLNVSKTIR